MGTSCKAAQRIFGRRCHYILCQHAGTWTASDAVFTPAPSTPIPLAPVLMPRYPTRKAAKDKEWPKLIDRAVRAVQNNNNLKKYDVVPPDLRDQYDVIGWLQVTHGYSIYQVHASLPCQLSLLLVWSAALVAGTVLRPPRAPLGCRVLKTNLYAAQQPLSARSPASFPCCAVS